MIIDTKILNMTTLFTFILIAFMHYIASVQAVTNDKEMVPMSDTY